MDCIRAAKSSEACMDDKFEHLFISAGNSL